MQGKLCTVQCSTEPSPVPIRNINLDIPLSASKIAIWNKKQSRLIPRLKHVEVILKITQTNTNLRPTEARAVAAGQATPSPIKKSLHLRSNSQMRSNKRSESSCELELKRVHSTNYKQFPKHEVKIRNNNPHRFFSSRKHSASYSTELPVPPVVGKCTIELMWPKPKPQRERQRPSSSYICRKPEAKIEPWKLKDQDDFDYF